MIADEAEGADICCASCGVVEVDDIGLMGCDDCDLVLNIAAINVSKIIHHNTVVQRTGG